MPSLSPPPPEQIHPALWRGTQFARAARAAVPTGYADLEKELPGGGWPAGALNELLLPRPGIGEMRLLRPALRALDQEGSIVLVQPPCVPHIAAWSSWGLDPARLLWVNPERPADALWSAEQVLKNGSCAALLCWLPQARPESLRRLHLAAQAGATLFFCMRPARAGAQASPAPLRLALTPAGDGLQVDIVKRRGPVCGHSLYIALERRAPARETVHPTSRDIDLTPREVGVTQRDVDLTPREVGVTPRDVNLTPREAGVTPRDVADSTPREISQPAPGELAAAREAQRELDMARPAPDLFDDHATLDRRLPAEAGA